MQSLEEKKAGADTFLLRYLVERANTRRTLSGFDPSVKALPHVECATRQMQTIQQLTRSLVHLPRDDPSRAECKKAMVSDLEELMADLQINLLQG